MDTILSTVLICLCIIIIILLIVLIMKSNSNKKIDLSKDFLNLNSSMNQNLSNFYSNINNTLTNSLNSFKDNNNDRLLELGKSISKVDEAQTGLKNLSGNVDQLMMIFNDKKTRGNFGETELYTILNTVYGPDGKLWHKQYRIDHSDGVYYIADSVIEGSKPENKICVDSKFPLENYLRIHDESIPDDDRRLAKNEFKKDVKKHIDAISMKYIVDGVTANLAFMFLPSEALFSEIYSEFYDLVNYAYEKHVFITSPTTILAYLSTIQSIYLEFKKEENSRLILNYLKELAKEFQKLTDKNNALNADIDKFVKNYKEFNNATARLTKKFSTIDSFDTNSQEEEVSDEND